MTGWDAGQADAWKQFDGANAFELGYEAGQADEARRSRQRDEQLCRLADAVDADENGDPSALDAFIGDDRAAGDDSLEVADAAGVTPLAEVDGGQLVDALEAWLAQMDGEA